MCDDEIHQGFTTYDPGMSRRAFGLTVAATAGLTAAQAHAQANVVEKDVSVKTPDGTADSALFYPAGAGTWPAVVIWTDILGLRPVFRDMGRRLAAQGYVVLVPNPFYRVQKAPIVDANFNFGDPASRAKLQPFTASITQDGTMKDAVAMIAFLDAQPQVKKSAKAGVQGYCMGGPLTFRTLAASPRFGAGATFHGGGLVTANADSPHLLLPKMKAELAVCVAQNDDMREPAVKDTLKTACAAAKVPAKVEVYPADHGWMVKGSGPYNEAAAEKGWAEMSALYKRALV